MIFSQIIITKTPAVSDFRKKSEKNERFWRSKNKNNFPIREVIEFNDFDNNNQSLLL